MASVCSRRHEERNPPQSWNPIPEFLQMVKTSRTNMHEECKLAVPPATVGSLDAMRAQQGGSASMPPFGRSISVNEMHRRLDMARLVSIGKPQSISVKLEGAVSIDQLLEVRGGRRLHETADVSPIAWNRPGSQSRERPLGGAAACFQEAVRQRWRHRGCASRDHWNHLRPRRPARGL